MEIETMILVGTYAVYGIMTICAGLGFYVWTKHRQAKKKEREDKHV